MDGEPTITVKQTMDKLFELAPRLSADEARLILAIAESRAAYRDDACSERLCDKCGNLYRGPAVYCCFDCAWNDR